MAIKIATTAYGISCPAAYVKITQVNHDFHAPQAMTSFEYRIYANESARQSGVAPLSVNQAQTESDYIDELRLAGDYDVRQPCYRWLALQHPGAVNV